MEDEQTKDVDDDKLDAVLDKQNELHLAFSKVIQALIGLQDRIDRLEAALYGGQADVPKAAQIGGQSPRHW